jgi:hypothetical protein
MAGDVSDLANDDDDDVSDLADDDPDPPIRDYYDPTNSLADDRADHIAREDALFRCLVCGQ